MRKGWGILDCGLGIVDWGLRIADLGMQKSDGLHCMKHYAYKISYKGDTPGAPYDGTGANEGDSLIDVPLELLIDEDYHLVGINRRPTQTNISRQLAAPRQAHRDNSRDRLAADSKHDSAFALTLCPMLYALCKLLARVAAGDTP